MEDVYKGRGESHEEVGGRSNEIRNEVILCLERNHRPPSRYVHAKSSLEFPSLAPEHHHSHSNFRPSIRVDAVELSSLMLERPLKPRAISTGVTPSN